MDLIYRIYGKISPIFRGKRMDQFKRFFPPNPNFRILDVGGYPWYWNDFNLGSGYDITVINTDMPENVQRAGGQVKCVQGDGTALNYPDQSFDLVFSNSVIEHLGNFNNQEKFAREACRVGKSIWIQTPARSFPIEPHFLTPGIHYLSRPMQKKIARRGTVWGWVTRATPAQADALVDELRLLTKEEMVRLFPHCQVLDEKILGLSKSYIAVRQAA